MKRRYSVSGVVMVRSGVKAAPHVSPTVTNAHKVHRAVKTKNPSPRFRRLRHI